MAQYHRDQKISDMVLRLMDELCTWERATGRETTLLLVPHVPDERVIVVANSGKPLPPTSEEAILALATAFQERDPELAVRLRQVAYGSD